MRLRGGGFFAGAEDFYEGGYEARGRVSILMTGHDIIRAMEFAGAAYIDEQADTSGGQMFMLDDMRSGVQCFFRRFPGGVHNSDELYITFRGSDSAVDWRANLNFKGKAVPYDNTDSDIRVHSGFIDAYKARGVRDRVLGEAASAGRIRIAGHSLGAAMSVLAAVDIQYNYPHSDIEVILFGCPRVGNRAFSKSYNKRVFKTVRVVNGNDIVTKVPLFLMGYRHVGAPFYIGRRRVPFLFSFKAHYPYEYYSSLIRRLF